MLKIYNKISPALIFLIVVALLFLIPLFHNQFYSSHDGEAHVARFGAYIKAFNDGQFPFRWAGDLNYSYGSPVFNFYYPLTGMIAILLSYIVNLENSFKLIIGFSFTLSFITFYIWVREKFNDTFLSVVGGIAYGLSPYHILNLYVRGDVAELLSLGIAPLVFLSIDKSIKKVSVENTILGGIFYFLMIISHNGISLMFSPVLLAYIFFNFKDKRSMILNFSIIIIGLVLASFFWIPAIFESKYTNINLFVGDMFKMHFPSLLQLIYSPWGFGPNVNDPRGLSPQVGIIGAVFVVISLIALFMKGKGKAMLIFWLVIFLSFLALTLNFSAVVWKYAPLLKNLQFPWRLVGVLSFAASILTATSLKLISSKKIAFSVLILTVIYSLQFLAINLQKSKKDSFYYSYPGTTYYHGQASPIWTAGDFSSYPKSNFEIIEGDGEIINTTRKSNFHTLRLRANTDVKIVDNTAFFPGWQVLINGVRVPVEFQDQNHRGLITFKVPNGINNIEIKFVESPIRLISDAISILGLVLIVVILTFKEKANEFIRKT